MRKLARGFSLIEMLGVVAIILILTTITLQVGKYVKIKAARTKAESVLAQMEQGCHRYMADKSYYPDTLPNYDATDAAMTDPWGVRYRYRPFSQNREFVVASFGQDMKPGVANYDDDRNDPEHPWRTNNADYTLWTETGYGDDIVRGDCTRKVRFPPALGE